MFKWGTKSYSLDDVFGLGEKPKEDCPTYIIRDVHEQFQYLIEHDNGHVVVYGASRQGKTWLIERYCKSYVRVGCDPKNNREMLFRAILQQLGENVGNVETNSVGEVSGEAGATAKIGIKAGIEVGTDLTGKVVGKATEGSKLTYTNINLESTDEVIRVIKENIKNKFIVLENFHYLKQEVQKEFATALREFLFHNIRVIIVGVWKESTKINALVPDLGDRVETVDIGEWTPVELRKIVIEGENALKIKISDDIVNKFIDISGRNVGMFKSVLKSFCFRNKIFKTNDRFVQLSDTHISDQAIQKSYEEIITPAIARIHKLASMRSGSKGLRYYIVRALLDIMSNTNVEQIVDGIPFEQVIKTIKDYNEEGFQDSNVRQELGLLHLREETIDVNYIPLFYFDSGKGKVLIVDSSLVAATRYDNLDLKVLLGPKEQYIKNS